jgi:hypothetical protein
MIHVGVEIQVETAHELRLLSGVMRRMLHSEDDGSRTVMRQVCGNNSPKTPSIFCPAGSTIARVT